MPTLVLGPLRIGPEGVDPKTDHRFLTRQDGTPFFYLADAAWFIFEKLTREEVDVFLADRASKKFTVIQSMVFRTGLKPNRYGATPFSNLVTGKPDPSSPNETYFQHIDYVVNKAQALGLYMAISPIEGQFVDNPKLQFFDEAAALSYGRFMGRRYHGKAIIWLVGSDTPHRGDPLRPKVWDAVAQGLIEGDRDAGGDGHSHLISFHPIGGFSARELFPNVSWLDFNMIQSGHFINSPNYDLILREYNRLPAQPVVDGEGNFEYLRSKNWQAKGPAPIMTDYDVRKAAYWSVFAGGAGYTYGNNDIYQFWSAPGDPGNGDPAVGLTVPWQKALNAPGAKQDRKSVV